MSSDNYEENEQMLEQQRRRKVEQFRLNIDQNEDDDMPANDDFDEPSELNSYSGQDVKEQMARNSKQALKQKKREEKKMLKSKNKRNRRTFRIIWIVSVILVGAMLSMYIITGMNDMLATNRTNSSSVKINIPENPDLNDVASVLKKNGVIGEESYFKMFASLTKSSNDFTQGTYKIRKNMDYEAIINYLLSSANRTDTVKVMITEGENVLEVANTLKKAGVISNVDKFKELCNSNKFDNDFSFLKAIKNGSDRYYKLEGYLYPDTYEFYKNEDPEKAIYRFLNNYEQKMSEKQDVKGYDNLTTVQDMLKKSKSGYSLDQIMTIASIIQAEAADTEDMYYVSSIINNRLTADSSLGVSNLGLDSTKYYPYRSESKVPEGQSKNYKSKYDTYSKAGLPAGPICNPGMAAITAALNPKDTDYYFFCHDSQGKAYYSTTMSEQNANLEYIESYDK